MSNDAKHWRQPERWNAEQFFECAGCGWRGTVADYRRDIRPPALACCPEHNLMPAATIDMAIHEAAELVEVMARAGEEIKRLRAENAPLRAFARDIMAAWPDGDVDGGALQEIAVANGLLVPETRTEPCGDECACAEYHNPEDMADGVTCYRRGPLLRPQGTAHDAGIQTALGPNAELRGAKPIGEASLSNDVLGADAPERN